MKKNSIISFALFLTVLLLQIASGGGLCADEMTWEMLLNRHEQYWANIKKIDVQFQHVNHNFYVDEKMQENVENLKRLDIISAYRWLYSESCEKLFFMPIENIPPEQQKPNGQRSSTVRIGKQYLTGNLRQEDWEATPQSPIEALENGLVLTMLSESNIIAEYQMPLVTFLNRRFLGTSEPIRVIPLSESVKKWKTIFPPIRSVDSSGDVLWTVRLETPVWFFQVNQDTELAKKYYLELVFNESKNFYLQRYSQSTPALFADAVNNETNERYATLFELIVLEYQKINDVIYFPKQIAKGTGLQTGRATLVDGTPLCYQDHYYIGKVLINEHVKEEIKYEIPENFWVYRDDLPADLEGREEAFAVCSIWGKNNNPLITFRTNKEYDVYVKNAMAYPLPVFGISKTRIAFIVIGLVMIITALIRLYFVREKGA